MKNTYSKFKYFILTLIVSSFCQQAIAQFSAERSLSQCETCGANVVKTDDINGDGELDVIVASVNDSKISWYSNLGNNEFGNQNIITDTEMGLANIHTADLDNDGDIDVLKGAPFTNDLVWFENNGNGTFSERKIVSSSVSGVRSIITGDLDNDGDEDILTGDSNSIDWFENDGTGNFSSANQITDAVNIALVVTVADLDNDGDLEVISGAQNGVNGIYAAWYENNGNGTFGNQNDLMPSSKVGNIDTKDFDNDGDTDLVIKVGNGTIQWLENMSDGTFTTNDILSTFSTLRSVNAVDFDNDGDFDILTTFGNDNPAWYENLGGGIYSVSHSISTKHIDTQFVHPADIDNDGNIDVLAASLGDHKVAYYRNEGEDNFADQVLISKSETSGATDVAAADLDNDGDLDIVTSSQIDNKIAWFENLGNDDFGTQKILNQDAKSPIAVTTADLDADGDMDILTAAEGDEIAWYENIGNGVFNDVNIITSEMDNPVEIIAADIDGDGDMDVLAASTDDDKIAWFENSGDGSFGPPNIIDEGLSGLKSINYGDLDNDGDMDVLACSFSQDKFAWYENLGNGSFGTETIIFSEDIRAEDVLPMDVDADGDLDVISLSSNQGSGGKLRWHENDGEGNFNAPIILSETFNRPTDIQASDVDNDGFKDIVLTSNDENYLVWFKNMNGTEFSEPTTIATAENWVNAVSIFPADLDADGDEDLVSALFDRSSITWYKNGLISPTFEQIQAKQTFNIFPNPSPLGQFTIQQSIIAKETQTLQIFNAQLALISTIKLEKNNHQWDITESLMNGIYFIRISGKKGSEIQQIIVVQP